MNSELDTTLRRLHACYCELTLRQPPYATCERWWYEFNKIGLDIEDLRLTIEHVQRVNKKRQPQYHVPLTFELFIGNLERFGSLLGDARAERRARDFKARNSYPEAKASVLRSSGRHDAPTPPEQMRPIGEVLRSMRDAL